VPDNEFEAALNDTTQKPTTAGIVRDHRERNDPQTVPVSDAALWLWGRLKDFERYGGDGGLLTKTPADVLLTMTSEMLDDVHRLAPHVAEWLKRIGAPDA
jgi:hypothetical protein